MIYVFAGGTPTRKAKEKFPGLYNLTYDIHTSLAASPSQSFLHFTSNRAAYSEGVSGIKPG